MERPTQNRAIKDMQQLQNDVAELSKLFERVILRGSFDSGMRRDVLTGSRVAQLGSGPSYADPTGEDAVRIPMDDATRQKIAALAEHVHLALNLAKNVIDITPSDVSERALRSVPDCAACGDPITGKIYYGRWDHKCRVRFKRWVESGNQPDQKLQFEQIVKSDSKNVHPS